MHLAWNRALSFASAAAAALAFAACENGSGPAALDKTQIDADLKELSTKVHSMAAPTPSRVGQDAGPAGKRSAKTASGDCILEGERFDYFSDTTNGVVTVSKDTSRSYTAAGKLICSEDDMVAYSTDDSYSRNDKWEAWLHSRMDYPPVPVETDDLGGLDGIGGFKFSGHGRVHYFSDYDIEIAKAEVEFGDGGTLKKFEYLLKLEQGRYEVVMKPAPGYDVASPVEPDPSATVMEGPITHGGQVVGYFEIHGDDSVVIKDAKKKVVSTH